jgi:hypothetical protein
MEGRERREWLSLGIREYVQEVRETKKRDINIKVLLSDGTVRED